MFLKRLFTQAYVSKQPFDPANLTLLLETHQYVQAADHLYLAIQHTNNDALAHLLTAARQMCLSLERYRAEIALHRRAEEEAISHESEARTQLLTIMKMISEFVVSSAPHTNGYDAAIVTNSPPMALPVEPIAPPRSWLADDRQHQLVVYCLGTFQVYRDDKPVESWPGRKSILIFKYLLMNRTRPTHKEALMERFWPDADTEAARNNLNVAIYGLRQTLRNGDTDFSFVLFQNDCYGLNPDLQIWLDSEAFLIQHDSAVRFEQQGGEDEAFRHYTAAEQLYQGSFLPEDLYEDWIEVMRTDLQNAYLHVLDRLSCYHLEHGDYTASAAICSKMLKVDPCLEEACCRLMRCYSRQGQSYLALRQYHLCAKALEAELDMTPMPATTSLYEQIRAGAAV